MFKTACDVITPEPRVAGWPLCRWLGCFTRPGATMRQPSLDSIALGTPVAARNHNRLAAGLFLPPPEIAPPVSGVS